MSLIHCWSKNAENALAFLPGLKKSLMLVLIKSEIFFKTSITHFYIGELRFKLNIQLKIY